MPSRTASRIRRAHCVYIPVPPRRPCPGCWPRLVYSQGANENIVAHLEDRTIDDVDHVLIGTAYSLEVPYIRVLTHAVTTCPASNSKRVTRAPRLLTPPPIGRASSPLASLGSTDPPCMPVAPFRRSSAPSYPSRRHIPRAHGSHSFGRLQAGSASLMIEGETGGRTSSTNPLPTRIANRSPARPRLVSSPRIL